jgi:hypothetical protein
VQYAKQPIKAPQLDKAGKKFIQEVTGVFLFLARAVDSTMLTPLSALASKQASPTELTMEKCLQFLNYAATQDNAILTYKASDIILAIHSNNSYLSEPKAQSQAGGHMFMVGNDEILINNGTVLNILQVIRSVMSSAAEAELAALFINAKNCRLHAHNTQRIRPSTNVNTDTNQQLHSTCTTPQQNPPKGAQSHGHAIPLAQVP